jgi:hypothetical protein
MKVCRSLDLYGSQPALEKLLAHIRKSQPAGWRLEYPAAGGIHVFSRPDSGAKLLLLLGFASPDRLMLANIHPTPGWSGEFTIDHYNQIVTELAAALEPAARRLRLILQLGPGHRPIEELMCPPTCDALEQFVREVEREGPVPEMHWFRFLSLIHLERALLRPPEFAEYLKTQGWAEPEAQRWAEDFSRCLSLLDVQNTVQRQVRVVTLADLPSASHTVQ